MGYHVGLPGAQLSPAVQHSCLQPAKRPASSDISINFPEFFGNLLNVIHKARKFIGQAQISAIPDTVNRFAHQSSSGANPVFHRLRNRVISLIKCVREKIGKETALRIAHPRNIRDKAQRCPASHASHHGVQADFREISAVRLGANPVVA